MKIERQFESMNFLIKVSIESKTLEGNSILNDEKAVTTDKVVGYCLQFKEHYEMLVKAAYGEKLPPRKQYTMEDVTIQVGPDRGKIVHPG